MANERHRPPLSLSAWVTQVVEHPSVLSDYENNSDRHLKLSSTSFSSGSEISADEYLRLQTIWHKYERIEHLGMMMTDDPEIGYKGYVSVENKDKASRIFDSKRSSWQPYLDELMLLAAEDVKGEGSKALSADASSQLNGKRVPRQPLRPSSDTGIFHNTLHWQSLVTTTVEKKPDTDELRRTSTIWKPECDQTQPLAPSAVNRPIAPKTPRPSSQSKQGTFTDGNYKTPEVTSYHSGSGGKLNRPAADEAYVNTMGDHHSATPTIS